MDFRVILQVFTKKGHAMDVLRKEINAIYDLQNLDTERLDPLVVRACRDAMTTVVGVDGDCRVITDASADSCFICSGTFARLIGLCDTDTYARSVSSSDEDVIYNRIHPEDLVDKRMLELEFFRFADALPAAGKLRYMATCHFRILDRRGKYIYVDNSTRILRLSPNGKIWLILCCYNLSPLQEAMPSIGARILGSADGSVMQVPLSAGRSRILTPREKEILRFVKDGLLSKEIADRLGISVNTVNRHRQNILQKLSVGNSHEALRAATLMKLL